MRKRIAAVLGLLALAVLAAPAAPVITADAPAKQSQGRSSWGKAVALVTVDGAEAHRVYTQEQAQDRVYAHYNHLCGTVAPGTTWCDRRLVSIWATPYGDHSWSVRYVWNERKLFFSYGCGVVSQLYGHTATFTTLQGPSCAI